MKIKKSELLALIKEEIMSEMYDDPRMDDVYPEVGEAQKIVDMIMDMSGGDKAAAMEMLKNAIKDRDWETHHPYLDHHTSRT